MKRLVSSLPLSALLFVVWLLLNQSVSPGTLLMGAVLAVLVPLGTKSLRPGSVTMRKPLVAFKLWAIVMRDFVRSNIRVATLILTRRPRVRPAPPAPQAEPAPAPKEDVPQSENPHHVKNTIEKCLFCGRCEHSCPMQAITIASAIRN